MSTCWFCEERETSKEASIKVKMRYILSHHETHKRSETRYKEQTVLIPRCPECKREGNREKIYAALSAFPSMALGILSAALSAKVLPVAKTFLGIVIGFIVFICCFREARKSSVGQFFMKIPII
ncbi:hypothetical protein JW835_04430 [bacterium]|nr:hypothetical protein [bacterium]